MSRTGKIASGVAVVLVAGLAFGFVDPIRVEVLRDENRVRAWIPALGGRTAIYREGFGCTLDAVDDIVSRS